MTAPLPEVSPVCDGDQLELNCTITGSTLRWRIVPDQNQSQLSPLTLYLSYVQNKSFEYSGSTVIFTSVTLSHPMEMTTYRTVFSYVNSSLNGTEVECTDFEDRESTTIITSTVIRVLNTQGIIIKV